MSFLSCAPTNKQQVSVYFQVHMQTNQQLNVTNVTEVKSTSCRGKSYDINLKMCLVNVKKNKGSDCAVKGRSGKTSKTQKADIWTEFIFTDNKYIIRILILITLCTNVNSLFHPNRTNWHLCTAVVFSHGQKRAPYTTE